MIPETTIPAEPELLDGDQEDVFSRTEVELGRIEHSHDTQTPPG